MSSNDSTETKSNSVESEKAKQARKYQEVIKKAQEVGRRRREQEASFDGGLPGNSDWNVTGW